ncbi:MAG: homoserine O-succinyltransferase [Bacteroidales bacterium]|nr:homoserine O-succinyltransferase [Bacteroidales bacterium]MBR4115265.1 homoserine O-succinyltransferase [Bacteroidales bacterium]MCR4799210.1 homoserine O-succinyltransferase [Bacteroidales bacterium]
MPVNIPDRLPAADILRNENVFVMTNSRAITQDIRPIRIGILNLMPIKEKTETQLIRMLSNTPLQVEVVLLYTQTHVPSHTSAEYLQTFYKSIDKVGKLDGLIITGSPIDHLKYEDVDFWPELTKIYEWTKENVTSTFHICWGAFAAVYYYYGINKHWRDDKIFGVFKHHVREPKEPIVRGFDDEFFVPHSRNSYLKTDEVIAHKDEVDIICDGVNIGPYLMMSKDKRNIFVFGHSEYEAYTLSDEYFRDKAKGMEINLPENYFPQDNPALTPPNVWRSHGNLLFSNWLNYYVYQETPYKFE